VASTRRDLVSLLGHKVWRSPRQGLGRGSAALIKPPYVNRRRPCPGGGRWREMLDDHSRRARRGGMAVIYEVVARPCRE